ncbi:TIGR02710 family CRISPR-associated CARF protein [Methylomicrobium sp. Wu6]|uniref:TIGR02710 family CRISPR-associated CARF protein n=1 Tax=Methylomicrobium sp. Wu6 TaxID=3107928 RepID=UPI002DD65679|nr:TIGR02710 family CRISPR-associated CARF protein [Methylomicrobium sp. Wu6]MEC4748356.1 TIGR02710 family CRISPR-associated CARF protein [Methylomicrobium sp. Wu6]
MTQILFCTVGGSHQPIVSAINDLRPDFVVFICTGKDPATGRVGSVSQIDGKGNCIKAHSSDDKPTLPSIPNQTGLAPEQYEVVLTLSDDLDQIYLDCNQAIEQISRRFPNAKLAADFTGGTKSMSAGMIMAALERPDIDLQLVTGSRADLVKVQDGSQFTARANSDQIRFQRLIAPYKQAWSRYAYSEAEAGLKLLKPPSNPDLRGQYTRFRELSRAFAEWDNFNHAQALAIMQPFAPSMPAAFKAYIGLALRLNDNNPGKREAARLFDLYRNAERRAAQGRFDDAIARVYRLIEWAAQWLLETHCGIKTGDIKPEQLPDSMALKTNRDDKIQAGLFDAWQLVKLKSNGPAAAFIADQEDTLLNHLKVRNGSILAHGFDPIQSNNWHPIHSWLQQHFIPMLINEAAPFGIKQLPEQLPVHYQA